MEWLFEWVRNIVCLYFILAIVTNILPDVEEKKYIQFFGSILVTICLLRPLLQLGNIGERLEQNVISNIFEEAYAQMIRETNRKDIVGESYVREACGKQMEEQVVAWMQVYGYDVIFCEVEFSGGEVIELENLNIKVKKQGEESQGKSKQEEFLKNELINVYNIPEGNINISIQE